MQTLKYIADVTSVSAHQAAQQDPYALLVEGLDRILLGFYAQVRRNSRRIVKFIVVLLPLMLLLVGSCKTSQLPASYGSNAGPEQFRTALFPDRVNFKGISYYPAEGYISRARSFVSGDPETLTLLTEREIGYLFGNPTMKRKDAEAAIWQYKNESCVVDFYFYDQLSLEGESRVAYVDVRRIGHDGKMQFKTVADAKKSNCFEAVIDEGDFSRDGIAIASADRI